MKYCDTVSVGAISLNKINLLLGAEVKVESHCGVVCLSCRKGDWVKVILTINGIACQAFYLASNLKATPLFLNLHICIPLI